MIPENSTPSELKEWLLTDLWFWKCDSGHIGWLGQSHFLNSTGADERHYFWCKSCLDKCDQVRKLPSYKAWLEMQIKLGYIGVVRPHLSAEYQRAALHQILNEP